MILPPVFLALLMMVSASIGLMVKGSMMRMLTPALASSSAALKASTKVTQAPITVTLSLSDCRTTCTRTVQRGEFDLKMITWYLTPSQSARAPFPGPVPLGMTQELCFKMLCCFHFQFRTPLRQWQPKWLLPGTNKTKHRKLIYNQGSNSKQNPWFPDVNLSYLFEQVRPYNLTCPTLMCSALLQMEKAHVCVLWSVPPTRAQPHSWWGQLSGQHHAEHEPLLQLVLFWWGA